MKKKLQVFISSTFIDLKDERQAAVEAILDAGHIPAGMELFKAGNENQLKTIKRWIDESDVYLLILGGRYGSLEKESGKSYTHLEYEYAIEKGMRVFATVLSEPWLYNKASQIGGANVFEQQEQEKYKKFKDFVHTKVIRRVEDFKDIKLSIHTTLSEFKDMYDFSGWVKGSEVEDSTELIKENRELLKENTKLKDLLDTQKRERSRLMRFYGPFDNEVRWFGHVISGVAFSAKDAESKEELIKKLDEYKAEYRGRFEDALEYCKTELPIMHYHVKWFIDHAGEKLDSFIEHIRGKNSGFAGDLYEVYEYLIEEEKSVQRTKKSFLDLLESVT
ncbi:DUF4062 domain-containing protein [Guptibacillus hwajinpoensis]|uniref:DUF4062 domain-containing protein n=1 Tax=Guptibacillus hwajinpoensis TaxID=208199 RepID=UPI003735543B